MMKWLAISVVLSASVAAGAQASDVTAEQMFSKHVSRDDSAGIANTMMRCSGLLAAMAKEFESVHKGLYDQAVISAGTAQNAALAIYSSIGRDYDQDTITGWTVDWAHHYQGRFEENMLTDGEKFGSDELIKADLQFCNAVTQSLRES